MKASELKSTLQSFIESKLPVFIWGHPGVGKSSIVKQIAMQKEYAFIDLRLTLLDPTDLRGIPFFDSESKTSVWAKPEFLPDSKSEDFGILFLDEINSAPPTLQAAAYQLILDRKIGEYTLPKNWAIIAAGNYEGDRGVTYKMASPLANRFVHLEFDLDFSEWKNWAYSQNISKEIISYLSYKPQNLFTFDTSKKEKAFATPRSWSFVDTILKSSIQKKLLKESISGAIGEASADEFINYCSIMDEVPDIDKIFEGDNTLPTKNSVIYALCIGLVYALKNDDSIKRVERIIEYSLNLPNEFAVMLIRDIQKEGIDVERTNNWSDWVKAHNFLIA